MRDSGFSAPTLIAVIAGLLAVGLGGFGFWAYTSYLEQKNDVDVIVGEAVTVAKQEQKTADDAEFAQREKSPVKEFVGPADLGQVTFNYPKTWSVFVGEDGTGGGNYQAYFNPGVVVSPEKNQPYALRLTIVDEPYETSLKNYQSAVQSGELKASTITVDGETGTRLDGTLSEGKVGAAIVLKSRDKTVFIYTEAQTYLGDFNDIILPSLKFNP